MVNDYTGPMLLVLPWIGVRPQRPAGMPPQVGVTQPDGRRRAYCAYFLLSVLSVVSSGWLLSYLVAEGAPFRALIDEVRLLYGSAVLRHKDAYTSYIHAT